MGQNLSKRGGFLEDKGEFLTKQVTESKWGISYKDMERIWKDKQGIDSKKINISSKGTIPGMDKSLESK